MALDAARGGGPDAARARRDACCRICRRGGGGAGRNNGRWGLWARVAREALRGGSTVAARPWRARGAA